mgnify:FL=1
MLEDVSLNSLQLTLFLLFGHILGTTVYHSCIQHFWINIFQQSVTKVFNYLWWFAWKFKHATHECKQFKKKINTIYFLHPARIFLNSWNREIDQFSLFILMSMIFSVVVDVVDVVEECVRGELADNEKFKKISKWMVRPNILSKNRITSITRTTKYIFNMVHINSHHW